MKSAIAIALSACLSFGTCAAAFPTQALASSEPVVTNACESPDVSISPLLSTQSTTALKTTTGKSPISPARYQKLLGKGMDVDWSKTKTGRANYSAEAAKNFAKAGVSHVRIRIADNASASLLKSLDKQVNDCLKYGIVPVVAYQADALKKSPSDKNMNKVVAWWDTAAKHFKRTSYLLSFDLLIECTDALNKQPDKLNELYGKLVSKIRESNPKRIVMISPRLRSDASYLSELKIPKKANGYLMAEWHFYAAGPSKDNDRKLWTTGTDAEKALVTEKIQLATKWTKKTGIPTWVGAWMPGNYNNGNDYSIDEQVTFSTFMTKQLTAAGIPFAVNSDTKFYNRETNKWIKKMQPVFKAIYG